MYSWGCQQITLNSIDENENEDDEEGNDENGVNEDDDGGIDIY